MAGNVTLACTLKETNRKINNKCFIVNCFCAKISEYYNIYNRYTDEIIGNDFVFHILDKYLTYSFLM